MVTRDMPIVQFATHQHWARWLAKNHKTSAGVWLKLAKKGSVVESVSYVEAVEAALCYGWIDGQGIGIDETAWLVKFVPRGPKSVWSKINRERAQRLIANKQMKAAGLAAVESAQQDGRWEAAYDSSSQATVPEDLQAALDRNAPASRFFATLNRSNRYAILYRIQTAKRPETRARRIEKFVAMLARNEKLYP